MVSSALHRLHYIFPLNFAAKIFVWFTWIQPSPFNKFSSKELGVPGRTKLKRRRAIAINYFAFSEQVVFFLLILYHYYTAYTNPDKYFPQMEMQKQREKDVLTFLIVACPLANAIQAGSFTRQILFKGAKCLERAKWTTNVAWTRQVRWEVPPPGSHS